MKQVIVIFLSFVIIGYAELWQINATDAAAKIPLAFQVEKINAVASIPKTDELPYLPGWPVRIPGAMPARGITLADFDGDGKLEVIEPTWMKQVYVWKYDGTLYPGWPRTLDSMAQWAASVADVDLDGDYEVAVNTRGQSSGGKVYLFDENGNNKPGWPFTGPHNGMFFCSPCLADINGDDTLEIIVGEMASPIGYVHVLRHDGTESPGSWPVALDNVPAVTAGVADINLDSIKEIIFCSFYMLYVFKPDGEIVPGWPQNLPNGRAFSYESPALADIDGDDTLEIIVAAIENGGGVYVWRHDGSLMNGWPFDFTRWTYCPPTIADLYRTGDLKVICGLSGIATSPADVLYAFDDNASVLSGFPITQPGAAEGNITVADIDGDENMEIIFTSNLVTTADTLGFLYAIHHDGSPVSGWPLRPFGVTYLNGVTVADVDGDDSMDIIAVSDWQTEMQVSIWEAGVPFNRLSWEWPTYHFDMARTGLYQPAQVGLAETNSKKVLASFKISPNPTHSGAKLNYTLSKAGDIKLDLYDKTGSQVKNLFCGNLDIGDYEMTLPPGLASGIYFVRLKVNDEVLSSKIILTQYSKTLDLRN